MKIHEFQAKQLLKKFGLAVPEGRECTSVEQAVQAFHDLKSPLAVVKAQIHAGGRGKAGGVKLVKSAEEAQRRGAGDPRARSCVTHQTGPQGQLVRRLWVEKGSSIAKEYYLGIAIDRESKRPMIMASSEGGMDIEEVAAKFPQKIVKVPFSPTKGLRPSRRRRSCAASASARDWSRSFATLRGRTLRSCSSSSTARSPRSTR